ncbi:hypothetical protein V8F06_006658 [Rhypophila decipiens]
MSVNVFRFFRPTGEEKEEKSEKRRAQVRRAQQTYRLRKDQYTRALEKEVSRLRSVEADLSIEIQRLRDTVSSQQRLLAKENSWGDLWDYVANDEHVSRETGISPLSDQSQLAALSEVMLDSQWTATVTSPSERGQPALPLALESHPAPGASIPPSAQHPKARDCQPGPSSELTTTAMEFVLALESPCLSHIHGDPSTPHQANGHALTTSSYVLSLSPQSPSSSQSPSPSLESNKAAVIRGLDSAPRNILDRLLALSTNFALEDELTPIQAWKRISAQMGSLRNPNTNGSKNGQLEWSLKELVRRLSGTIKCHGFGAVLKVDVFEKAVRDVMIGQGWESVGAGGNISGARQLFI